MTSLKDSHTERQWQGKFFRCGMECWYCRLPLVLGGKSFDSATKDHLTPLSRGGSDAIGNIVPACVDCNRLKGEMTEQEFRTARANLTATSSPEQATAVENSQNLLEQNEPGLIKKVVAERERVSWAWRNPA